MSDIIFKLSADRSDGFNKLTSDDSPCSRSNLYKVEDRYNFFWNPPYFKRVFLSLLRKELYLSLVTTKEIINGLGKNG